MNYVKHNLVGTWKTDQRKPFDEAQDGDVVVNFNEDGTANYSIYYPEKRDIVHLTYIVEADHIITKQGDSAPLKTQFAFERDGSLLLWFNGVKGRFLRVK
jgi:hypothetical protein